jgi:hypothetical protein
MEAEIGILKKKVSELTTRLEELSVTRKSGKADMDSAQQELLDL